MFSRNGPKKRNRTGNASLAIPSFAFILFLFLCSALLAADKVRELQDHFDRDPHADSRVKTLDKLSQAQFESAAKAGQADDYSTVGFILEKYRDNVRAVFELLKKQQPDAERHANPYRQLELQVRRGVREVEETILVAPDPVRPPLEIVRQDLIATDDELIRLLFPRRTKEPTKVPTPPEVKP
jgi:hypothetical protein